MQLIMNSDCSKSRTAAALLRDHGQHFEELHYLDGISPEQIAHIHRLLDCDISALIRTTEAVFAEFGGDLNDFYSVYEFISRHPIVLQRPILLTDEWAIIARPPEVILTLLVDN